MIRRDARLLVVDDEPLSRVATHHALRALGCRVIDEASEGAIALQLLASERYDLVIANWRMASMSGRELISLMRETPHLSSVPVVVATPVTPKIVAEAADAGVSAFLPRPFGFNTLEQILKTFLGQPMPAALKAPARVFVS